MEEESGEQLLFRFSGETYDKGRDQLRLSRALDIVRSVMSDGGWHYIAELSVKAGCSEAAASARIRDLRKDRFGGYTVTRENVSKGLWRYRIEIEEEEGVGIQEGAPDDARRTAAVASTEPGEVERREGTADPRLLP